MSIWAALKSRIGRALAAAGAFLALLGAAWLKGRSQAKQDAERDKLQNEVDAHDRINRAETGANLDDAQRVDRLRKMGRGEWPGT